MQRISARLCAKKLHKHLQKLNSIKPKMCRVFAGRLGVGACPPVAARLGGASPWDPPPGLENIALPSPGPGVMLRARFFPHAKIQPPLFPAGHHGVMQLVGELRSHAAEIFPAAKIAPDHSHYAWAGAPRTRAYPADGTRNRNTRTLPPAPGKTVSPWERVPRGSHDKTGGSRAGRKITLPAGAGCSLGCSHFYELRGNCVQFGHQSSRTPPATVAHGGGI